VQFSCCCCKLEDTRLLLADQQHINATQSELYEKTIADVRQELDGARTQLKESKDKVAEPSSLLLHLQQELLSVKVLIAECCLCVCCKGVINQKVFIEFGPTPYRIL